MAWSVGIDLGGTNMAAGLVDDRYRIIERVEVKTRAPQPAASLASSMADCIHSLLKRQGLEGRDLSSIGLGLPGVVDPQKGILLFAPNLELEQVDFPSLLSDYFPETPVYVSNDADCAVFGEYLAGEAKTYDSTLFLTLGTGLGGGFIFDGKLYRGATGLGIEPGHMTLVAEGGLPCSCGQLGCFEVYVTSRGLRRLVLEELADGRPSPLGDLIQTPSPEFDARLFFEAVRQEDPAALRALDRYTSYLAMGIRTLVVLYRPHLILLGGGISQAGPLLLDPLRIAVKRTSFAGDSLPPPPIQLSRLGNEAGIIGAALLYREGCV